MIPGRYPIGIMGKIIIIIVIIIGLYKNRMLAGAEHSIFEKLGNILPLCKELSEYTREIRGGPYGT
jgi:hypothetical protein